MTEGELGKGRKTRLTLALPLESSDLSIGKLVCGVVTSILETSQAVEVCESAFGSSSILGRHSPSDRCSYPRERRTRSCTSSRPRRTGYRPLSVHPRSKSVSLSTIPPITHELRGALTGDSLCRSTGRSGKLLEVPRRLPGGRRSSGHVGGDGGGLDVRDRRGGSRRDAGRDRRIAIYQDDRARYQQRHRHRRSQRNFGLTAPRDRRSWPTLRATRRSR